MSEQQTPPEGTEEKETKTEDQKVPYSRFDEVNKARKELEDQLESMRNKLVEFEDRDKSEVERERAARERAESQLGELLGKVTSMEKGAWVRAAAASMKFHDPEDAVAHLKDKLGGLEDEREAKRLVEKLAKNKEHLVQKEVRKERPSFTRQYGNEGPQTQPNGQQQRQPTAQERAAAQEMQFAESLRHELAKYLPENQESVLDFGDKS